MKKLFFAVLLFLANTLEAQIFYVSSGTDLFIKSGEIFSTDSLTLTPSADFTISGAVSLTKNITLTNSTQNTANHILKAYKFSATTNAYSGTVQINYSTAQLTNSGNTLVEADLRLNVHNGTNWAAFSSTTNDATNNYVLSSSLSSVALNELTLADVNKALPVNWLSFTAKKQGKYVLLNWSTSSELNSRDFTVHHNLNSGLWNNVGIINAAGNSNTIRNYSYLHNKPIKGNNFYRILQRDFDGKFNFSEVRMINMEVFGFTVQVNPVTNGQMQLNNTELQAFNLFTIDGKLLWTKQFDAGIHVIDVSRFAKGIYLLQAGSETQKIVIE